MSLPHTPGCLLPVTQSRVTVPCCGQSCRDEELCWALLTPLRLNKIPRGSAGSQPCFLCGEIETEPGLEQEVGLRAAPCLALGQLRGHPWSHPTTGMGPASSPCALEGLEVPYISDRLCDTCPMGSKQALPTKFQVLRSAPRYIHTSVLRNKFLAKSERFCCLTNSGTTAPGVTFLFSPGCAIPPWILSGVRQHLPSPARPAAALGQARSFGLSRRLPGQSRSSLSPPRRGERGEEIAADGAASAAGLGMTKFGSATCWLFFLLWRIRASRWSNSPREPRGIHPDLGAGPCRAGERVAGERGGSRGVGAALGW